MHPAISYELARARIAGLSRQARRKGLAHADAPVPSTPPQRDRNQISVSVRRAGSPGRFGKQLRTILHAQVLLDGPARRW